MAFSRKSKTLEPEALWEYALRCLDRKAYSTADLRQKLKLRADTADSLRKVMDKLGEYGLLNDQKFAESFAISRLEGRGHGAGRVVRDLLSHRIPARTAEQTVQQIYASVDEADLIRQYLERKFRSKDLKQFLSEEKNLASAYRRLRTAGFSANGSIGALKQFTRRADELEDTEAPEED
jgi:regulatory protein